MSKESGWSLQRSQRDRLQARQESWSQHFSPNRRQVKEVALARFAGCLGVTIGKQGIEEYWTYSKG